MEVEIAETITVASYIPVNDDKEEQDMSLE